VLLSALLGVANFEDAAILFLFALTYSILILYADVRASGAFPKPERLRRSDHSAVERVDYEVIVAALW